MPEKIEKGPEKETEKEILFTEEERNYLRILVSREQAQARPESPYESMPTYKLRESLLRKLE